MENSLLLIEEIIVALIVVFGLWLGFWVWSANRKERLNQWFAVMAVSVVLWVVFAFLGFLTKDVFKSAFFYRLNAGAVVLSLVSAFYFYIIHFLNYKEKKKYKILEKSILSIGIILIILSVFTNMIIKKTIIQPWGSEIIFGPANALFNLYAFFIAILVIGLLVKRYFQLPRPEKLKTQYFLIGTTLFALFNVIFNIISPIVTKTVAYQHFGDYSAIFLLGFTAYAIVKRELFGIKIILTELLIGAIGLILLVQIFIAPTSVSRILNSSIFILFVVFAYYLIKAIFEESKRREEAEKIAIRESALRKRAEKLATDFKRLDEAKTQFTLATQHHLRTPLTSIQGYLSMLYEGSWGEINPVAKSKIRGALESTQKLIRLVNELLDIAKLEVGKEIITKRETQIEEILQEVINELEPQAKEKGIFLKFEKPESLPKIMVDLEKIKESIYNLILNGINYTLKGGVTLKLEEKEGKSILISFKDTGIGMKEEEIEGLFERTFERGKRAKKLYTTGRGIGLYLASQIIKAHQGKIWAESPGPGKGSTFYIELPIK